MDLLRILSVDFFLEPLNFALVVVALVSGGLLLLPIITGRGVSRVSVTQATQLINTKAQIIDVRDVEQYAAGHIQNAKSLPYQQLSEQIALLKLKKDKPVLLVCESDKRAAGAVKAFAAAEFGEIHVLEGGLKAWREAQLPLVK
ncbi:rhodanese-like domain-containing protein [Formosimonas limnophila]|uniref:Rhodanese-like domain-containing protein n=1 Tax=Formosimonas limnophila TaxID=1384487 RepID=A0A8J3CI37_9BURK|nr:rhodanese-like domain-containing protein [Formosimonas limnophila]